MDNTNKINLGTCREIMGNWERIFDLELLKTHLEWTSGETIQACIEKIKKSIQTK